MWYGMGEGQEGEADETRSLTYRPYQPMQVVLDNTLFPFQLFFFFKGKVVCITKNDRNGTKLFFIMGSGGGGATKWENRGPKLFASSLKTG